MKKECCGITIDLGYDNNLTDFSKKLLNLEMFFDRVSTLIEAATGHCKYEGIRAGDHVRGAD